MRILKPSKRVIDHDYLNAIRKLPCVACGKYPAQAHHIKTVKTGGGDDWFNVIPLCFTHHTGSKEAWHVMGSLSFLKRFPHVREYLSNLGWEITEKKLYHRNRLL